MCKDICHYTIKLEVGKTYVTATGEKVKIIAHSLVQPERPFIGEIPTNEGCGMKGHVARWTESGKNPNLFWNLVREVKEPVVYTMEVIWYKWPGYASVYSSIHIPGYENLKWTELHRQTVSYTEKS